MKTRLLAFAIALLAIASIVQVRGADQAAFINLALPSRVIAQNSTNTTPGVASQLYGGQTKVRLYLSASGIASTTNGSLIVRLSTATGTQTVTNEFDNAAQGYIYLTLPTIGATTNTVSDWFFLPGVQWVRVGQIENSFAGPVSNMTVRLGYSPNP